ncbi:MAG: RNA polymerase sigma factor SigJ [Micromonosporaceae bacterium]|nr:RNA polymerase sigma factor SigJ [Micromonosporaceae bacterium]
MAGADPGSSAFEEHRADLLRVAYRLLGSHSDAEDAVQEAWLRWNAADRTRVVDAKGWLVTVLSRICLDVLRSARVRRESYVGPWLPEPVVHELPAGEDPADTVVRGDEVSYALLVVMERLTPDQRVAFVLHDAFGVPFDQIAATLEVTPEAARQLASRARRTLTEPGVVRHTADLAEQRRVLAAFTSAVESGDLDALVAVLAPDAVAMGDGGGVIPAGRRPVVGADRVARLLLGLVSTFRDQPPGLQVTPVLVNGDLGLVVRLGLRDGSTAHGVIVFAVADGRITGVFNQLNPAKLRLPAR